jgi:hypothetical protein
VIHKCRSPSSKMTAALAAMNVDDFMIGTAQSVLGARGTGR